MNTARASVPTHTRRGFVRAAAGGAALLTACSFPTSLTEGQR